MVQGVESNDGDLARAVAAKVPGLAEQAETELYRRFAPRVRLYGLRHLRDEEAARDLVQQVMLLTIEKLRAGSIREVDHIGSFILGVSRTISLDLKRRDRRRERLLETFPATSSSSDPHHSAALDSDRAQLSDRAVANHPSVCLGPWVAGSLVRWFAGPPGRWFRS